MERLWVKTKDGHVGALFIKGLVVQIGETQQILNLIGRKLPLSVRIRASSKQSTQNCDDISSEDGTGIRHLYGDAGVSPLRTKTLSSSSTGSSIRLINEGFSDRARGGQPHGAVAESGLWQLP